MGRPRGEEREREERDERVLGECVVRNECVVECFDSF